LTWTSLDLPAATVLPCTVENHDDSLMPAGFPNDAFFKEMFSDPPRAIAFFQSHLPPAIVTRVDWPSLKVLPSSFIKSGLQQVSADLLFAVKIGDVDALLYLLFEHQSTVDPSMPLRMLGYVYEILLQHHKEHGLPLPPVLPFVFHQGPDRWNVSTAFEDLFEFPDDFAADLLPFLPKFRHALLDLTRYDPEQGEDRHDLQTILQLMKFARKKQVLPYFKWQAARKNVKISKFLIGRLLIYALHVDSDLDVEQIYRSLTSNPELQKTTMSVAEKLIAKGRIEGLEKGRSQGIAEGISRGRSEGRVEGRSEGRSQGYWMGRIQSLEEFLDLPQSKQEALCAMDLAELEALHQQLHREYKRRFK
jgi:predicted transposase/invertase (TIGR01784 family)